MTLKPAARVDDDIAHSNAGLGMLTGVLAGAAVGAVLIGATVATGGLALVAAAGAAAGMVSAGGLGGLYIGEASMGPSCGKFVVGSVNVFINGRPALFTAGSFASCNKDAGLIALATGSSTVLINTGMAGREGEKVGCGAVSVSKVSPNVFIGGDSAQDPDVTIQPEVPQWAVTTLQVLGVAGAIAALPFAVATVGVAATIGGAVVGGIGAVGGAVGGRALGEALGMSEAGIRSLEVAGGFLGGMVGGAAGTRGVQAQARFAAGRIKPSPDAATYRPEVVANAKRIGIPPSKVQSILDMPKDDRLYPSEYIPAQRLTEHSEAFADGASRITTEGNLNKYGLGQRDGTTFVGTRGDTDKMLAEAAGDPRKLEQALGLPQGQLEQDKLVRVDFDKKAVDDLGIRMPSGREAGANDQWLPGGFLADGKNEAVIDGVNALPEHYTKTVLNP